MTLHSDMNGIWSGRYEYSDHNDPVKFTAWFDDSGGAISGTIMEPNTFVPGDVEELQASITGARHALEVEFVKRYDIYSGAHNAPIIYSGTADKAFTLLRGTWAFPEDPHFSKGIFELSRTSVGIERARLHGLLSTVGRR